MIQSNAGDNNPATRAVDESVAGKAIQAESLNVGMILGTLFANEIDE